MAISIGELIAEIHRGLRLVRQGREELRRAYELLGDVLVRLTWMLAGSAQLEAEQILGNLTQIQAHTEVCVHQLDATESLVWAILNRLSPGAPPAAQGDPAILARPAAPTTSPRTVSSDEPPVVPANRIEELRRELPPRVTAGQGRKTHGRWVGADGATRSIISGRDHDSEFAEHELERRGMPGATTRPGDVELKLAAHMLRNGIRHVTVVINHSPCKGDYGCDTLVPILLPEGSTLTVHGVTRQGAKMYKRYTGGATPWWR